MRFVDLKTQEQLDVQSLHRVRSRLVGARTSLINQFRAVLLERGVTAPQGRRVRTGIEGLLNGPERLPDGRVRQLVVDMREEWVDLDARIGNLDTEFVALARADETARRLTSIPGIGALNATALPAAAGNAEGFDHARDFGA